MHSSLSWSPDFSFISSRLDVHSIAMRHLPRVPVLPCSRAPVLPCPLSGFSAVSRADRSLTRRAGLRSFSAVLPYSPSEARSSPHPSAPFPPCLRPSERVPVRSVPSKPPPGGPGGGFDGTERTVTRSDGRKQARAALTGAVRTGSEWPPCDGDRRGSDGRRGVSGRGGD